MLGTTDGSDVGVVEGTCDGIVVVEGACEIVGTALAVGSALAVGTPLAAGSALAVGIALAVGTALSVGPGETVPDDGKSEAVGKVVCRSDVGTSDAVGNSVVGPCEEGRDDGVLLGAGDKEGAGETVGGGEGRGANILKKMDE